VPQNDHGSATEGRVASATLFEILDSILFRRRVLEEDGSSVITLVTLCSGRKSSKGEVAVVLGGHVQ
jgi:hypothetical protein